MIKNTLFRRAMGMAVAGALGSAAWAQSTNITSAGFTYTQNFNGLSSSGTTSWANNSTIAGWSASGSFGGNYAASDGSAATVTSTGDLYSLGAGSAADRALGSAARSGSGNTGPIAYGVQFWNTSGASISRIHVSYTGEQWRVVNQAAQPLTFEYKTSTSPIGIGDASFTGVTGLNFTGPKASLTAAALDGNAAANRTLITVSFPVTLANNSYIFLRWTDGEISGSGSSHFLGIDDLFVSVPEAGTWGAGLGLFGLLGWTAVRRGRGSR